MDGKRTASDMACREERPERQAGRSARNTRLRSGQGTGLEGRGGVMIYAVSPIIQKEQIEKFCFGECRKIGIGGIDLGEWGRSCPAGRRCARMKKNGEMYWAGLLMMMSA
jgi:hypothetical protein